MKVNVYPADLYGCGHYRLIWPARAAKAEGLEVEVFEPGAQTGLGGILDENRNLRSVHPPDCDVVVFQRPTNKHLSQAVPLLRQAGVAVVVDMDDDLSCIHPANPAHQGLHPRRNPTVNWQWAAEAARNASLVTVSTPGLQTRYGSHGRCRVIRNRVPASYLEVERREPDGLLGWAGALHSHPDDISQLGPSVSRLVADGNPFRVIGPLERAQAAFGLQRPPEATGAVSLDAWPQEVAELSVAVAPLADTRFNRSKSWLKPLEYSALGVAWAATPLPEYDLLIQSGAGTRAQRPKDWYHRLRLLLRDDAFRRDSVERGREVARELTIEAAADEWADAWLSAGELERKTGRSSVVVT